MTTLTDDQLALLKQLGLKSASHVPNKKYFEYERLEQLGFVKISVLSGSEFHCEITDNGRAALASFNY